MKVSTKVLPFSGRKPRTSLAGVYREISKKMFIAACFVVEKNWKQFKYPIREWQNKVHKHTHYTYTKYRHTHYAFMLLSFIDLVLS